MNTIEAVDFINHLRKQHLNSWYSTNIDVNGQNFSIQGFKTWVRTLRCNNVDFPCKMRASVKEFKEQLEHAFNYNFNQQ